MSAVLKFYPDDGSVDPQEMLHRGDRVAWLRTRDESTPMGTIFVSGRRFAEDSPPELSEHDPRDTTRHSTTSSAPGFDAGVVLGSKITLERPTGELAASIHTLTDPSLKYFVLIPPRKVFRMGVFGITGTGKSKFAADNPIMAFNKLYPSRKVYIMSFSAEEDEPAFDDVNVEWFDLGQPKAVDRLEPERFRDSLLVFDDIESILDPEIFKAVSSFRDTCLMAGRKLGISSISICHEIHDWLKTRTIINECDLIVLFNQGNGNVAPIKKLLGEKFGLGPSHIKHVLSSPTRWVAVKKSYPSLIISPQHIEVIQHEAEAAVASDGGGDRSNRGKRSRRV